MSKPNDDDNCRSLAAMWKALWENDIGGIVEVVGDGDMCYIENANAKFAELVGRDVINLQGVEVDTITHPADRGKGKAAVRAVIRGDQLRVHQKKRYVQPDGKVIWTTISSSPVYDEDTGLIVKFITLVIPVDTPIDPAEVEAWQKKVLGLERAFALVHETLNRRTIMPSGPMPNINIGTDTVNTSIRGDRGANISNNDYRIFIALAAVLIPIVLMIIVAVALIFGRNMTYQNNGHQIHVSPDDSHDSHYHPGSGSTDIRP